MENITAIGAGKNHIDLWFRYQIVISDLHEKISIQKKSLYMSLGSDMNQTVSNQEYKQNKRGLINIIGNVIYTLFGVGDDKCTKKTREVIKQTEESGSNILYLMKAQTIIVNTIVKNIGNILNQTEQLYKDI